jgi:cell division transport system ATP-binding protein
MIQFVNVSKKYKNDEIVAVENINLDIDNGEFVFLIGPSGSGKTTLIRLLIMEEYPDEGKIFIDEADITSFSRNEIYQLRRKIGVIFQDYKLLDDKTAYENIAFVLEASGASESDIEETVPYVLDIVGLADRANSFPPELSGGEKQRIAIARALANDPKVLIADEPTGNLDPDAAWEIVKILQKINDWGTTVIMSTHGSSIVDELHKRVIRLEGGQIVTDKQGGYKSKMQKSKDDFEQKLQKDKDSEKEGKLVQKKDESKEEDSDKQEDKKENDTETEKKAKEETKDEKKTEEQEKPDKEESKDKKEESKETGEKKEEEKSKKTEKAEDVETKAASGGADVQAVAPKPKPKLKISLVSKRKKSEKKDNQEQSPKTEDKDEPEDKDKKVKEQEETKKTEKNTAKPHKKVDSQLTQLDLSDNILQTLHDEGFEKVEALINAGIDKISNIKKLTSDDVDQIRSAIAKYIQNNL